MIDKDTGSPIACRMHLKNFLGKPVRPPKTAYWNDHFTIDGQLRLKLPAGNYSFEMERGPEYLTRSGHFTIHNFSDDSKTIDMKRFAHLADEGWWSGDLHVRREEKDIQAAMRADDLHVAPLVTWSNAKNPWAKRLPDRSLVQFDADRFYHLLGGSDLQTGGSLHFFNLREPLPVGVAEPEYPPPLAFMLHAKMQDGWIDAEKPYSWDLPVWVADGMLDSIQLAHSDLGRTTLVPEAGGYERDKALLPGVFGGPRWSQEIYYHLLNCGLRIPPTAGSGSGAGPNPIGYNRVYVHVAGEFSYEKWWEGLRAGRAMVTNGPLLRPIVDGQFPGHVFRADAGETLELEIGLTLSTRDRIDYLEVIKNGRVEHEVRLDDWKEANGRLPKLIFKESGWFLVRAVATGTKTYRFACTAPYYVEIGERPHVSRRSAQFFLDWVNKRIATVKLAEPKQHAEVLATHDRAREYWESLLTGANAP